MPVFPLVGSMTTVSSPISPSRSAASIMDRAMRSFTLHKGLKFSSLHATVAAQPCDTRLIRTSGVLPMHCVMSPNMHPFLALDICGSP